MEIISIYNGLLEYNDYISVYDEEFESSLSFSSNFIDFKNAYKESPEYFIDEIIISIYHFIITGKILECHEVISDIKHHIMEKIESENIQHVLKLVDNRYEWIDLDSDEKANVVANNIRKLLQ